MVLVGTADSLRSTHYMNIKYSVYTLHGSCTEVRSVYMSFVVARMQKDEIRKFGWGG